MAIFFIYLVFIMSLGREYSFANKLPAKSGIQTPKLLPILIGDSYQEGSDVEMYCTLISKNVADTRFHWFKDGTDIDQMKDKLANLKIETNDNRGHSFLSLSNITDKDAGEYTCMAENSYGSDRANANLIVSVELSWLIEPKDTQIGIGHELSLNCTARGQPRPIVRWSKLDDKKSLNDGTSSSEIKYLEGELKIKSTKQEHSGWYECKATNNLNREIKKIVKVDIQGSAIHSQSKQ